MSLRDLYEQKHRRFSASKRASISGENRLRSLEHVRARLDELEDMVTLQSNANVTDSTRSDEALSSQMREISRCLSTFIDEQRSFNGRVEERLRTAASQPSVSDQLQQQVSSQGLIVNLNTAYREIAVLQSDINALQSENNRLASSISFDHQYHRTSQPYAEESFVSASSSSSRRPHMPPRGSSNASLSKSSIIGHSANSDEHDEWFNFQRLPSVDDDDDDEQQSEDFFTAIFNAKPSHCHTSAIQGLNKNDTQTLDLQVKSVMVQLIPYASLRDGQDLRTNFFCSPRLMRLFSNETLSSPIRGHLRQRMILLFNQEPETRRLLGPFIEQFIELIDETIENYARTT